jgi:capsular polysaccharide transport system ATP-binding protein
MTMKRMKCCDYIRQCRQGQAWPFRNFSASFPVGTSAAILAPPGGGKSTLIELLTGSDYVSEGSILRTCRLSWTFGSRGHLSNKLSCRQNLRFISDLYGAHFGQLCDFVAEFAEFSERTMDKEIRLLNGESRNRLNVASLLGIDFDFIVVDDAFDYGDLSFRRRTFQFIDDNRDRLSFFMATSDTKLALRLCSKGGVLRNGAIKMYGDMQEAVAEYVGTSRDAA